MVAKNRCPFVSGHSARGKVYFTNCYLKQNIFPDHTDVVYFDVGINIQHTEASLIYYLQLESD